MAKVVHISEENELDFLDEIYKPKKYETEEPVANTEPQVEKGYN